MKSHSSPESTTLGKEKFKLYVHTENECLNLRRYFIINLLLFGLLKKKKYYVLLCLNFDSLGWAHMNLSIVISFPVRKLHCKLKDKLKKISVYGQLKTFFLTEISYICIKIIAFVGPSILAILISCKKELTVKCK